jgi:hypothetical protein
MARVLAPATIFTLVLSLPFIGAEIHYYFAGVDGNAGMYALGLLLLSLGFLWASELEADSRIVRDKEWYARFQKTRDLANSFKETLIWIEVLVNRGASMEEIEEYVHEELRKFDDL